MLSPHFSADDLLYAGETWKAHRIQNVPRQQETWDALALLCEAILEPLLDRFGRPTITYGFASPELLRHIKGRIAPTLDQHAGCELRPSGLPICRRLGQAADILFPRENMADVAAWIAERLPFDRLYFYGIDRPIHVSVGPDRSKAITALLAGPSGRRIPRAVTSSWLLARCV